MNHQHDWRFGQAAFGIAVVWAFVSLWGCGSSEDPAAPMPSQATSEDSLAQITRATPSLVTPEQLAEAFALMSTSTDVQREMLEKDIVGSVVEWDIQVYEVEFADGVYTVTSQAIPIKSGDAVPLLRVMARIRAPGERDDAILRAIKTDEWMRVRGRVNGITLRTVVLIEPAVLATP